MLYEMLFLLTYQIFIIALDIQSLHSTLYYTIGYAFFVFFPFPHK